MGRDAGPRETLAERTANTRARSPGSSSISAAQGGHSTAGFHGKRPASWAMPPNEPQVPATPPPALKHCWYDGGPAGRQPALLVRWRNVGGCWEGLVIAAAPDESGQSWAVAEFWVESGLLSPA